MNNLLQYKKIAKQWQEVELFSILLVWIIIDLILYWTYIKYTYQNIIFFYCLIRSSYILKIEIVSLKFQGFISNLHSFYMVRTVKKWSLFLNISLCLGLRFTLIIIHVKGIRYKNSLLWYRKWHVNLGMWLISCNHSCSLLRVWHCSQSDTAESRSTFSGSK